MSLIADRKGRLTSPEWFEPGAEDKAYRDEQGRIVLEKMAKMCPRRVSATVEKHGNFTCLKTDSPQIARYVRRIRLGAEQKFCASCPTYFFSRS